MNFQIPCGTNENGLLSGANYDTENELDKRNIKDQVLFVSRSTTLKAIINSLHYISVTTFFLIEISLMADRIAQQED